MSSPPSLLSFTFSTLGPALLRKKYMLETVWKSAL